jgi:hypothetical protein
VTGTLQGLPCAFQKKAVLRVNELCLSRVHAKELGVEKVGSFDDPARANEFLPLGYRILGGNRILQILFVQSRDRVDTVYEVVPELIQVLGAGKPSRHSNDRDAISSRGLIVLVHLLSPANPAASEGLTLTLRPAQ